MDDPDIYSIFFVLRVLEAALALGIDGWAILVVGLGVFLWLRSAPRGSKPRPRFPAYTGVIQLAPWAGVVANAATLSITRELHYDHFCPLCMGDIRVDGTRILHGFPWCWFPTGILDLFDLAPVPARLTATCCSTA